MRELSSRKLNEAVSSSTINSTVPADRYWINSHSWTAAFRISSPSSNKNKERIGSDQHRLAESAYVRVLQGTYSGDGR